VGPHACVIVGGGWKDVGVGGYRIVCDAQVMGDWLGSGLGTHAVTGRLRRGWVDEHEKARPASS